MIVSSLAHTFDFVVPASRRSPERLIRAVNRPSRDPSGGVLDSHLFFYDRYSDLAEYHRLRGRTAKAEGLAAIAEAYYQAAPDDDDEPEAAAMAMPVPHAPIRTNAVSTTRVPKCERTNHRAWLHRLPCPSVLMRLARLQPVGIRTDECREPTGP